jgi:Planctomycete cytochrome C/Anaphase-promoting complex subunit 4 WD40 domain
MKFQRLSLSLIASIAICLSLSAEAQEKVTYTDHVLPLIEANCAKCHNSDKKKGDLDLTTYSGTMKGGGSGALFVAGNPDSSKLIKVLAHAEEPSMPPNKPPLPEKELAIFKKWIAGGLLETSGSKAIAAARPSVDLTLKVSATGKPEGPPPMPRELSLEPALHTTRGYAITGLAASPWAPLLAVAGQKQVLLYNTTSLDLIGILPFTEGQPSEVKFSRSGKLLLAAGGRGAKSGKVILWNVESGERITTIGGEYDTVVATDISPDQSRVAIGGTDRLVKIFSTKTGELEHKIKKHTDWITALAFSPSGEMLATADRNGGVTVWDADNAQELFTTAGHKGAVTALSWRSDSRLLASASEDGTAKLWENTEGKQARTWNAHPGGALNIAYSHDGQVLTCGRDGSVVTWNADGSKLKSFEFSGEMALRCAWSHDGSRVFASDFAGRVAAWDAKTARRLGDLNANPLPLRDQLAAAEKRLAELQEQKGKPDVAISTAEAELAKLEAAIASAQASAEKARGLQAAKEQEVVRLKELTNSPSRPADLDQQLVSARASRLAAREALTNAVSKVDVASRDLGVAKAKVESLRKSHDPAALLAAAEAEVDRLRVASKRALLFTVRDTVAARSRELANIETALKEKQAEVARLNQESGSAADAAAKAKAKAALKIAQADLKSLESQFKKTQADLTAEQARLEKLTREQSQQKASAEPVQQQSRR